MLTTDLVRVYRRNGHLHVPPLRAPERARLLEVAQQYVALAKAHVGQTRGELEAALDRVSHVPTDYKRVKGLRKLLHDRCIFEVGDGGDPPTLRQTLFAAAAAARRALGDGDTFDRDAILRTTAATLDLEARQLEASLFADLKENHLLNELRPVNAAGLLDRYELAQHQAVLLRATIVVVHLRCFDASAYRAFFQTLKFRRLLHSIEPLEDGGYRIRIDGPFSLFQAVTKYGLQLALLLPALQEAGAWKLDADIRWGKDREPFRFHLEGDAGPRSATLTPRLPEEVQKVIESFERLDTPWKVKPATNVLELPGLGLCVPDLLFEHRETGQPVHLEVMGYWSRQAVWRRVELVQAGLPHAIIFALSSRLRVSEEVLDGDLPGQLYVYKGVLSANAIAKRLDAMTG